MVESSAAFRDWLMKIGWRQHSRLLLGASPPRDRKIGVEPFAARGHRDRPLNWDVASEQPFSPVDEDAEVGLPGAGVVVQAVDGTLHPMSILGVAWRPLISRLK